jgi:hypothetical protein
MPWVYVRHRDSPGNRYKEERFYFETTPDQVKYTLTGPSWATYVSAVCLEEDESRDGTACDLSAPFENGIFSGQRVLFGEPDDAQIPYGAEGVVVGATVGPDRHEEGYLEFVRVRFYDSTWDVHYSSLEQTQELYYGSELEEALSCHKLVVRQGCTFEVWDRETEAWIKYLESKGDEASMHIRLKALSTTVGSGECSCGR